jgi:hypothetical protein
LKLLLLSLLTQLLPPTCHAMLCVCPTTSPAAAAAAGA